MLIQKTKIKQIYVSEKESTIGNFIIVIYIYIYACLHLCIYICIYVFESTLLNYVNPCQNGTSNTLKGYQRRKNALE